MYFLLSGKEPFMDSLPNLVFKRILNLDYSFDHMIWKKISLDAKNLIRAMLKNVDERIKMDDILNHSWFKKYLHKKGSI